MSDPFAQEFFEDAKLLGNVLRADGFRFVLIGHNRRSIYEDLAAWLRARFPQKQFLELSIYGKNYRTVSDELTAFERGTVLIPDFDWLLQPENAAFGVAFNQRRDHFARREMAFLCFIQPGSFQAVAKALPDWWSGRSVEIRLERVEYGIEKEAENESISRGSNHFLNKKAELLRLQNQLELAETKNYPLLINLNGQIANVLVDIGEYGQAFVFYKNCFDLNKEIGDRKGEANALISMGMVSEAETDDVGAFDFYVQSGKISQDIGDRKGEGSAMMHIGQLSENNDRDEQAHEAYENGLRISQEIGDQKDEAWALIKIGQLHSKLGEFEIAFDFFNRARAIYRMLGDRKGEANTIYEIGRTNYLKGEYRVAVALLEQSLKIRQEISDNNGIATSLNAIGEVFMKTEHYKKAIPMLLQASDVGEKAGWAGNVFADSNLKHIAQKIGQPRYDAIIQELKG